MRPGFLLPLIFGYLVFRWLRARPDLNHGRRDAFLSAAAIGGVYLVAVTELLNAFAALTTFWVTLAWTAGCVGTLLAARWTQTRLLLFPRLTWTALFRPRDPLVTILFVLIVGILGIQTVLALFSVSNAWDSMTYHLARVAHWLQNRSVVIYATSCMYQNQHSPWAEWSILHLMLLQGNDHLSNFVQWFSYLGSLVAVSLITEKCGGTKRAGLIAAFFAATLPMALLQASTTENDEVMTFWLLCLVYGILRVIRQPTWPRILFVGAGLGLALMTKTLSYLFAPAFILWLAVALSCRGCRIALPRLIVCGLIALILNSGFYARNWSSAGVLLGSSRDSGPGYNYENEIHTPGAIFSNILRNLSLQTLPWPGVKATTEALVVRIHHLLGLDPADPRLTTYADHYFIPGGDLEDEAPNPLHFLVLTVTSALLLIYRRRFGPEIKLILLCVCLGALLFCVVLKWQPFHSRLHLPLLMLLMPMSALVLDVLHLRRLILIFIALMFVEAGPLLFYSDAHPLLGKSNLFQESTMTQRFVLRRENQLEYETTLHLLARMHATSLGVIGPANNSGWEYPLFDPDRMAFSFPWRIEQVRVENGYAPLETPGPIDAVISLVPMPEENLRLHGQSYRRVFQGPTLSVYLK